MRTISNLEIAKRLYANEKIGSYLTLEEILRIVDLNRGIEDEITPCDAEKVYYDFLTSFLKSIELIVDEP